MLATITMGLMLGASACATQRVSAPRPEPEAFTFTWTTSEGDWTHAARIERPAPGEDNGLGVMLFGGGLAADMHWTVPGVFVQGDEELQFTLDGEDTRDADTLAGALADAGFTVLRYSAVAVDDPLYAQDRAMAQVKRFPETVAMATAAWDALLDRADFEADEVFVLAHSLGAPRGVLASEGAAAGYVFLAGAYTSPQRGRPSQLAEDAADAQGEDSDGSGTITGWERAAARALREGTTRTHNKFESHGSAFEWPTDTLDRTGAPVLAVWGGLDAMSYHGPVLEHLLGDQVETVYFADLGHNLGREEGDRTGPIEGRVVERVVAWLSERAGAAP